MIARTRERSAPRPRRGRPRSWDGNPPRSAMRPLVRAQPPRLFRSSTQAPNQTPKRPLRFCVVDSRDDVEQARRGIAARRIEHAVFLRHRQAEQRRHPCPGEQGESAVARAVAEESAEGALAAVRRRARLRPRKHHVLPFGGAKSVQRQRHVEQQPTLRPGVFADGREGIAEVEAADVERRRRRFASGRFGGRFAGCLALARRCAFGCRRWCWCAWSDIGFALRCDSGSASRFLRRCPTLATPHPDVDAEASETGASWLRHQSECT